MFINNEFLMVSVAFSCLQLCWLMRKPVLEEVLRVVIDRAKRILEIEAEAILDLRNKLNSDFNRSVDILLKCEGKVIVTGMGKSGLVSNKTASTLACS